MDPSTIDESVDMKGPTPNSNWVIPGKLIAGAYPGDISSEFCHQDTILSIIDAGMLEKTAYCDPLVMLPETITCAKNT